MFIALIIYDTGHFYSAVKYITVFTEMQEIYPYRKKNVLN
jgi:hypothetical protein